MCFFQCTVLGIFGRVWIVYLIIVVAFNDAVSTFMFSISLMLVPSCLVLATTPQYTAHNNNWDF